jgi:Ca2+-binding RTX toxin-like protein
MASQSRQNFIDRYLVDAATDTYQIDHFVIVNNGVLTDGDYTDEGMSGSGLNDILWDNGGDDLLYGGKGKDLLTGGSDDDELFGRAGDDRLEGWHDADLLTGGAGNDALYGGNTDDYLCAGSNSDELSGGAGADLFVFRPEVNGPKSQSVYMDFQIGIDELRIDGSLMPDGFK